MFGLGKSSTIFTSKIILVLSLLFLSHCDHLSSTDANASTNIDSLESRANDNNTGATTSTRQVNTDALEAMAAPSNPSQNTLEDTSDSPIVNITTGQEETTVTPDTTGVNNTGQAATIGLAVVGGLALIIGAILAWKKIRKSKAANVAANTAAENASTSLNQLSDLLKTHGENISLDPDTEAHIKHLEDLVTQKNKATPKDQTPPTAKELKALDQEIAITLELTVEKVKMLMPQTQEVQDLIAQVETDTGNVTEVHLKGMSEASKNMRKRKITAATLETKPSPTIAPSEVLTNTTQERIAGTDTVHPEIDRPSSAFDESSKNSAAHPLLSRTPTTVAPTSEAEFIHESISTAGTPRRKEPPLPRTTDPQGAALTKENLLQHNARKQRLLQNADTVRPRRGST